MPRFNANNVNEIMQYFTAPGHKTHHISWHLTYKAAAKSIFKSKATLKWLGYGTLLKWLYKRLIASQAFRLPAKRLHANVLPH